MTNLITFNDQMIDLIDKGRANSSAVGIFVYFDFRKGFDAVFLKILIEKLMSRQ